MPQYETNQASKKQPLNQPSPALPKQAPQQYNYGTPLDYGYSAPSPYGYGLAVPFDNYGGYNGEFNGYYNGGYNGGYNGDSYS